MTIKQVLQKTTNLLKKRRIKNPSLEAEILLSHILKKNREFLFTYPKKELTMEQVKNYKKLIAKRLKGEPVAYLTGRKGFYGLDFFVNKNVLIPRPETELMVEEALKRITRNAQRITHNAERITLIDVGTGSGCIIITLAKQISDFGFRISDYQLLAVDISKSALAVAKRNAISNKVDKQIKLIYGDLLKPIILNSTCPPVPGFGRREFLNHNSQIIILANLPYLTPSQIKSSPTIKYEPKMALNGGKDGLKYYKELFKQTRQLKSLNPASFSILCEIDPGQTGKIEKLAQSELPEAKIKIKKDLAGHNRLAIIEI